MAEGEKEEANEQTTVISKEGLHPFLISVVDDCLYNVIREAVSSTYSIEKKLRMQSAAVQIESNALQTNGISTPSTTTPNPSKPLIPIQATPQGQFSTATTTWDNGKITLNEGNPLQGLKENYCPNCKLPRLMFPLVGVGARPPDDPRRAFCTLQPFIQQPGHDIYGNPFPVDQTGKTKKEREAIRKLERQEKDNTPGSADTGNADGDSTTGDASIRKLLAGGKGASYVPWHTCPQCKRSLLITKFAQHLEKCMGIGGRSARNTAAARLSGLNGSMNGSQQGSRNGTPTPSQSLSNGKRDADDDDDDGPPKKKVKKDKKKEKSFDKTNEKAPKVLLKLKNLGSKADGNKPATSSSLSASSKPGRGDRESSTKRDRDEGGDSTPKKKMKLNKDALTEITAGAQ